MAETKILEWWEVEKKVANEVAAKGIQNVLPSASLDGPSEIMRSFNLHVRAGDKAKAENDIAALAKFSSSVPESTKSQLIDFVIGREQWQIARLAMEKFPDAKPGWGYVFIRNWQENRAKPFPADIKMIDNWLSTQIKNAKYANYWVGERVRFREKCGTARAYLDELAADLKAHPDEKHLSIYLGAIDTYGGKDWPDVSWLATGINLPLAYDKYMLASRLPKRSPETAIKICEASLATPFTPADHKKISDYMRTISAIWHPADYAWDKDLRAWTKQLMVQCYQHLNKPDKAQALLVELSHEHPGPQPRYALTQMAGQIQSQLEAHPLEQMIKKAEPENKNSSDYWLGRADYYVGRKENAQAVDAFKKALSLTALSDKPTDSEAFSRVLAVDRYLYYLNKEGKKDEASKLWYHEFDSSKSLTLRNRLINSALNSDFLPITYNDERIWNYLAEREKWGYSEEHIFRKLLGQNPSPVAKDYVWQSGEKLAKGNDPSRSATLAWMMSRTASSERAIPLLEIACTKIQDKDELQRAKFTLFEAFLDTKKWQAAEKMWTGVRERLTPNEQPSWMARIALCAAKAGAKQDALRLWKAKDQIDPGNLGLLDELAKAGLKPELVRYYEEMKRNNKISSVPEAALKSLGSLSDK